MILSSNEEMVVGPIFVRRGDVLFVLKSPDDFFDQLKAGKILPADRILVRDQAGAEWLPVSEISQFQVESNTPGIATPAVKTFKMHDIFDHIRQPKFNWSALLLGGFWYIRSGMRTDGYRYLRSSFLMIAGLLTGSVFLQWPLWQMIPLIVIGWFGSTIMCGLRADHDLNKVQVKRFHHDRVELDSQAPNNYDELTRLLDPQYLHDTVVRQKILN